MNSPFLHFPSLETGADDPVREPAPPQQNAGGSPFQALLKLNGERLYDDPRAEQFVRVMDELYDEEFEESTEDLLNEISETYETAAENNAYLNQELQVRQRLHQQYMPLQQEVDRFFNHLTDQADRTDAGEKTGADLEHFLERFQFESGDLSDIQEHWLGGLKKLVGKAYKAVKSGVKKVGAVAARFGLGFLFRKLKGIVKSFLAKFLEKGIGLLPAQFQDIARTLAAKVLPKSILPAASPASEPAGNPAEEAQQAMNAAITHLLTASDEMAWERIERELEQPGYPGAPDLSAQLNEARQAFTESVGAMEEGESAEPPVENFVQAIITPLRFVMPIVGRERVMGWLSSLLAKLIGGLVGKENAKSLSRQMVETGFKMLNLETQDEQDNARAGASAVTATVEDTIRQLEHFPNYVFEDRQLFERHVVRAFEKSAAANLPDMLPEQAYKKQPDLRESSRRRLNWIATSRKKGNRWLPFRIKRLNEVIEAELTPFSAEEIRTFGGASLATFLRDRMGVPVNGTVRVRVHLFETLPGSRLPHISKYAEGIPGLGSSDRAAWMQLHPLTSIAAGLLMGEPGLGCQSKHKCLSRQKSAGGHRYYYIEVPGASPQVFRPAGGRQVLRRATGLQLKLDFPANELRLCLFLSEADAQAVAVRLRKNQPESAHVLATMALETGVKNVFSYGQYGDLKVVHPGVIPGKGSGLALETVPPVVLEALKSALKTWVGQALVRFLRDNAGQFVQAAEDDADGVTLQAIVQSPPDFSLLRQMLTGASPAIPEAVFGKPASGVLFNAKPGYDHV